MRTKLAEARVAVQVAEVREKVLDVHVNDLKGVVKMNS